MRLRLLLLAVVVGGALVALRRPAVEAAAIAAAPAAPAALPPPPAPAPAPAPARRRSLRRRLPVALLGAAQWGAALAFGRASGGFLPLYVASVLAWLASWLWAGLAWSEAPEARPGG